MTNHHMICGAGFAAMAWRLAETRAKKPKSDSAWGITVHAFYVAAERRLILSRASNQFDGTGRTIYV